MMSSRAACSRVLLAVLLGSANLVQSVLYTDVSQLTKTSYDFVVVGAGSAGGVIASRLTENPDFSVLVIEAGVTDVGVLNIEVPFLAPSNQPNSSVTWNFSTTPQSALNDRILSYTRGRVLGGSSSINFLVYTRGSNEEYDRWANLTGDSGWAWDNLAPYYYKNSRLVPPVDDRNITGLVDPSVHGAGPILVSLPGQPSELDNRVLNTSKEAGTEFPFSLDIQSGDAVGVGIIQLTAGGGVRSSSSTAFLEPAINRTNLDVLIQTTVTKLIKTGETNGNVEFKMVELAANASTQRSTVTAKKEVILSAGSIGTPQILMLSGIGNGSALNSMGIQSFLDLPDVGQHLTDHPIMSSYFVVDSNATFDDVLRNPGLFNADLAKWMANKTGLFSNAHSNTLAFLRIPDNSSIFQNFTDPAAGPHSGHFEMLWSDGFAAGVESQPATGHFLTISTAVTAPLSRGSVQLASTDPFTFPLINPGLFESPFDEFVMLEAVKAARRFVQTAPWDGFIVSRYGIVGGAETDDEIVAAARQSIRTLWHPASTARMAPANASYGVVDPNLCVKGAEGLRVVDASIFPVIPSAHTVGPVYIVAERAAALIKAAWS